MGRDPERDAERDEIRRRNRIDEVARELAGCEFTAKGPNDLWAPCPFHQEDTPSFHVLVDRGFFKCFGCGEAGDLFTLVMKLRGVDFRESLHWLADRVGMTVGDMSPEEKRKIAELKGLREVLVRAGEVFAQALRTPQGAAAVAYLKERGFVGETATTYDVGLVPADYLSQLRGKGLSQAAIERAGFTTRFVGRLSFGIRDAGGALVGFGARTLEAGGEPKYVNTRETQAFSKRKLLYGLDKAARAVTRSRRIIVMEGYTDVMMAHQCGVEDVVATMGTSLTDNHVRELTARARNLVFVFDGDGPGQGAAERAVQRMLQEGIEVRVLTLPDGVDPADWFRTHDAEAFDALLAPGSAHCESTVAFLARRMVERADRGQPGWKEAVAGELVQACSHLVDPLRRGAIADVIAREIARACSLDPNNVRNHLASKRRQAGPSARRPSTRTPPQFRSARDRCQYAVLGAVAVREDGLALMDQLMELGVVDNRGVRRLLEIARPLGPSPVDPFRWKESVAELEPSYSEVLDHVLFPRRDGILEPLHVALAYLRDEAEKERLCREQQANLARPDVHEDEDALRALQDQVLARRRDRLANAAGGEVAEDTAEQLFEDVLGMTPPGPDTPPTIDPVNPAVGDHADAPEPPAAETPPAAWPEVSGPDAGPDVGTPAGPEAASGGFDTTPDESPSDGGWSPDEEPPPPEPPPQEPPDHESHEDEATPW